MITLPIRKVQTTNLTFASSCAYGFPWFSLSCLRLLSKVQHKIGPEPGSSVEDHFGCLQKWAHGDLEIVAKPVALPLFCYESRGTAWLPTVAVAKFVFEEDL